MNELVDSGDFRVVTVPETLEWALTIEQQFKAIFTAGSGNRPWSFCELHNPWSRSAASIDSWKLLDICQSPALIRCLVPMIGEDIILFDSEILPNPALANDEDSAWRSDRGFFPLSAPGGAVVRIPFGKIGARTFEFSKSEPHRVELGAGQIIVHEAAADYRLVAGHGNEFVARYFPADLAFDRDPLHPTQQTLTNRFPWLNYTKMALWLVNGEDRAGNDFVTGFRTKSGRWTGATLAGLGSTAILRPRH